jgi:hypothetical protein
LPIWTRARSKRRPSRRRFRLRAGCAGFHVDEVDDDQATEVAQTELAGQFFGRFHVGLEGGFLDIGALGRAAGVDVDGNQCFGVVDDDGATGRQIDLTGEGGFDLVFDLEAENSGTSSW